MTSTLGFLLLTSLHNFSVSSFVSGLKREFLHSSLSASSLMRNNLTSSFSLASSSFDSEAKLLAR